MISSEDVRHVTFDKAFQGYRREDVDDYLKQVAQAMDDLAAQNDDLQKKLVMLAQRIEKYRTMENSLSTSMINAQRTGTVLSASPSRKRRRSSARPTSRRRTASSAPAMTSSWPSRRSSRSRVRQTASSVR